MRSIFTDNQNPLIPDRNLSFQDDSGLLNIRCPHCAVVGAFKVAGQSVTYGKSAVVQGLESNWHMSVSIRQCPNQKCGGLITTVSGPGKDELFCYPPETIDFDPAGIPPALLSTLEEAIRCHAAGCYKASTMMVRRLLEEICDQNGAKGKNLHTKLGELREHISLPDELFDAMFELKALGNDAAHIAARNYTDIGQGESEDSIELAKEILKMRYQLKSLLQRLQKRKSDKSVE